MIKKGMLFLGLTFLVSCYKDEELTQIKIIKESPNVIIAESELVINVGDENGDPLIGLTAYFNDDIKVVDQTSFFHFSANNVNKFRELLQITDKSGYNYDYLIYSQPNEVNYRAVNIFVNKQETSINSNESKTVSIGNDVKLLLSENNYQLGQNQGYTGKVSLRYNEYDVDNINHLKTLPGGVIGIIDNSSYLLEFESAFDFNFYSNEKQLLNLKKAIEVTINTIPEGSNLFHYDNNSRQWTFVSILQSGQNLFLNQSGTYAVAKTKNFSIVRGQWNINNVAARQNKILFTSNHYKYETYTSNSGNWEAIIPSNETVSIFYQLPCGALENESINTSQDYFNIGVHNTTSDDMINYSISGQFKGCDGQLLHNGFIQIKSLSGFKNIFVDTNLISLSLPLCKNQDLHLNSISENSELSTVSITDQDDNIDFSTLFLCEKLKEEYLVMTVDGNNVVYDKIVSFINDSYLEIKSEKSSIDKIDLKLVHENKEGKLQNSKANIVWEEDSVGGFGLSLNCPNSNDCGFEDVTLTYWQKDGPWLKGRFEGIFWVKTHSPVSATYKRIKGEFQLKRQ